MVGSLLCFEAFSSELKLGLGMIVPEGPYTLPLLLPFWIWALIRPSIEARKGLCQGALLCEAESSSTTGEGGEEEAG